MTDTLQKGAYREPRDAALTAKVKAALLAEQGLPSLSISVDTYEAQVRLTGFVRSPEIVSRAGRVTAEQSGASCDRDGGGGGWARVDRNHARSKRRSGSPSRFR